MAKTHYLLIDADSLIHRAFHALPPLQTKEGILVGAVFGFASMLLKALGQLRPDAVLACFDTPGPTFRHKLYPRYKERRVKPQESLRVQFPLVLELLEVFRIPALSCPGFEADDLIGTLAHRLKKRGAVTILSGDLDILQLVGPGVRVLTTRRGLSDTILYDEEAVRQRFRFPARHLPDYKALVGDPSDDIPGVHGLGERTAAELLSRYQSLEGIFEHLSDLLEKIRKLLGEAKEQVFLARSLATIRTDVPVALPKKLAFTPAVPAIQRLFERFQFQSLIPRLEAIRCRERGGEAKATFKAAPPTTTLEAAAIDAAVEPILRKMEKVGVLVDRGELRKMKQELGAKIAELERKISSYAGHPFTIGSPKQLATVLFDELKLSPKEGRIKKTKTGRSTAAEELTKLIGTHPIVEAILSWRELTKLRSTYLGPIEERLGRDGRIHTTFGHETATGRLTSRRPNLQNLPIKTALGRKLRRIFIAPPGFLLMSADYSQIELRIAAHFSRDRALIEAFQAGRDIHEEVGQTLGVDRRTAKILNFGILYGASPYGLSQSLGLAPEQARALIEDYFSRYHGLRSYIEEVLARAYAEGYVETLFCRRRYLPELANPNPQIRAAGERMAINAPIQGTAADILKLAMIEAERRLLRAKLGARLLLSIHDELVFEVPSGEVKAVAHLVREAMEGAAKLVVPLVAEVRLGRNLGEMKEQSAK